jgi:hypothetical protein
MKYLPAFLIFLSLQSAYGQASAADDFKLKVTFEDTIPVKNIRPYYYLKSGNAPEEIAYTIDTLENSILLFGHNEYVLWVSFPVLVFTLKESVSLRKQEEKREKTTHFYLFSEGPLSSYTGEQTVDITFSYETPIVVASLRYHNKYDAFKELKIQQLLHFSGDYHELNLGNEMIKIDE